MFYNFDKDYMNNVCLISDDYKYTYRDIDKKCSDIIKIFKESKNLILVKSAINIETIIGYLSFLKSNQAMILVDGSIDQELIHRYEKLYRPNYIWELINDNHDYLYKYKNYGLRKHSNKYIDIHPKLSLMLSTSGSTGSPKMVRISKENIVSNTNSINDYLNIASSDAAITNLPFHYSYGLSIINTHIARGASIVVTNKSPIVKDFWNIFKKYKVTSLNGVPYNYEIFKRIGIDNMNLPSLRYMTQAGGKLNEKLIQHFEKFSNKRNISFYIMYGQTEATARISFLQPNQLINKISSIGKPIKNGELLIKDINGKYISEPNKEGELVYKGKNVMLGYASSYEDLKKDDELDYILPTGDLAFKDKDGYFFITGRMKRFIKIHGNRVSLDEIENSLNSSKFEVACVGEDNNLFIVSLNKNSHEAIKDFIKAKFSFHHSTFSVVFVDEFPISTSGKLKYSELLRQLL